MNEMNQTQQIQIIPYITTKRFKGQAITSEVNIPYGTEVQCVIGYIVHDNLPICADHSQNAYDYFARNDDGKGLERGKLIQEIKKVLSKKDDEYQARWDKVWENEVCQKYKRVEYSDYWLWNHEFYNAEIEDLRHIAGLLSIKI